MKKKSEKVNNDLFLKEIEHLLRYYPYNTVQYINNLFHFKPHKLGPIYNLFTLQYKNTKLFNCFFENCLVVAKSYSITGFK